MFQMRERRTDVRNEFVSLHIRRCVQDGKRRARADDLWSQIIRWDVLRKVVLAQSIDCGQLGGVNTGNQACVALHLEDDSKSDRDVKSRTWHSWKGVNDKHDRSNLHHPSEPTVCGGDGTPKGGDVNSRNRSSSAAQGPR